HQDLHSFPTRRSSDLLRIPTISRVQKDHYWAASAVRLPAPLLFVEQESPIARLPSLQLEVAPPDPRTTQRRPTIRVIRGTLGFQDRKSTRLNSSHVSI